MRERVDSLSYTLGLSPYQRSVLTLNHDKYNLARLVKRGGVLYAPRVVDGFWGTLRAMLFGAPADLIGESQTFVRGRRGITFCANGYHCVRDGKGMHYCDACGRMLTRDTFVRATGVRR